MSRGEACLAEPPYENGSLRDGAGRALRPGGAALTERAVICGAWLPGQRVIDVGCGGGTTLAHLRSCGLHAVGVDISEPTLCRARRQDDGLAMVRAGGDELPFPDGAFDGALAECSFSLMPDAARALAEFHRVLRPGGRLVITDVYARDPGAFEREKAPPRCLANMLVPERTRRQLGTAGFGLERWEDHSEVLRTFLARFIFEHGSLDALFGAGDTATAFGAAARRLRPGYALLVARKGAH